jgi:GntR family transcriptional regulator
VEFEIDANSDVYGYRQLANKIAGLIESGEIIDRLPSLNQLVEDSGLSMSTVQHAIKVLKDDGLVYTIKSRGMFVRRDA